MANLLSTNGERAQTTAQRNQSHAPLAVPRLALTAADCSLLQTFQTIDKSAEPGRRYMLRNFCVHEYQLKEKLRRGSGKDGKQRQLRHAQLGDKGDGRRTCLRRRKRWRTVYLVSY